MYASLIDGSLRPDMIDEAIRRYREQIVPLARQQFQGFRGMYVLTDRASGQGLTIALYATEEDARLVETRGQFGEAVAALRDLIAGPPTRDVREVTFHDRAGTARYARVTDAAMDSAQLDQTTGGGGGAMAEAAAQQSGYAGFLITADRASGKVTGMSFWDSMEALEASEHAYYQPLTAEMQTTSPPRRRIFEVSVQE